MNSNLLFAKKYENNCSTPLDSDFLIFSFKNIEDFISFLTEETNCLQPYARRHLMEWYTDGIFSSHIYRKVRNQNTFKNILFINKCYCCNTQYYTLPFMRAYVYMTPIFSNMVIKYRYDDIFDYWNVTIRILLECNSCSSMIKRYYRKIVMKDLLYVYRYKLKLYLCKGVFNYINTLTYGEPLLIKYILYYVE